MLNSAASCWVLLFQDVDVTVTDGAGQVAAPDTDVDVDVTPGGKRHMLSHVGNALKTFLLFSCHMNDYWNVIIQFSRLFLLKSEYVINISESIFS